MRTNGTGEPERLATLIDELRLENAQLAHALSSRVVIEQAKGVLAERYRLDVESAFEVLRSAARSNRLRIHDLASSVVTSPQTPRAIELVLRKKGVTSSSASVSASPR